MPELIDKKRTEAKVFLIARFFIDRPDREVELVKAVIHRCCKEIDKQPTIEAEPVRHGRWIEHGGGIVATCSNCYATYHKDVLQSISPYAEHLTRHCPQCGARMDATDTNVGGKGGEQE